MSNEDAITRAEEARRIVDSEIFQQAFQEIADNITQGWAESRSDEKEKRDLAYLSLRLLHNLKDEFERVMVEGKHAQLKNVTRIQDPSKLRSMING